MLSEYPAPQQPRSVPGVDKQLSSNNETNVSHYSGWHTLTWTPIPRKFSQRFYDNLRTQSGEGWGTSWPHLSPPHGDHKSIFWNPCKSMSSPCPSSSLWGFYLIAVFLYTDCWQTWIKMHASQLPMFVSVATFKWCTMRQGPDAAAGLLVCSFSQNQNLALYTMAPINLQLYTKYH